MLLQLLGLSCRDISCNPILLEDYTGESGAEYRADNPLDKLFLFCEPDKTDEANKAKERPEPRCDYLLVGKSDRTIRFIELKGYDIISSDCSICRSTWAHGFHQLIATFNAYRYCCEPGDSPEMILCSSIPIGADKGRFPNYKRYRGYRELLQMFGSPPRVFYRGEIDEV